MATGSPLFHNSYDRVAPAARLKLLNWNGLSTSDLHQIEYQHGAAESASLRDLLQWMLDTDVSSRPTSAEEVMKHAFFDPKKGTMREHFVVEQITRLLAVNNIYDHGAGAGIGRINCNVFVSYSWADSGFVLNRLAIELATVVKSMWLDRLGGANGMGEFTQASMRNGVENADVVLAVVSPEYIKSVNCGIEMELAAQCGKTVIPIMLGKFTRKEEIARVVMARSALRQRRSVLISLDPPIHLCRTTFHSPYVPRGTVFRMAADPCW